MNRKLVLIMSLTLLIGMLNVAFNVQRAKASGTIYVRADGSIDPPTAPISTVDNIIYTFTGNIYDSIVVERSNIVIDGAGYTVTGSGNGITLTDRGNVTVRNMTIINFGYGIWLLNSSGNTLFGNNVADNQEGIFLYSSCNNSISGNKIANNGAGIALGFSSNYNTVSGNNITANNTYGIGLYSFSNYNTVSGNNITNNYDGIRLNFASNNKFYHNSFIDNRLQVYSYESTNIWDDGYPSGGNYWSDYNGTDLYGGSYQNETGSDGIGDTSYAIDANNQDRYPLLDTSPPTTIHDYDGTWHTVDFTIKLTFNDDRSGIAETYYKINDGPIQNVSAHGQPLITAEGTDNKLEYWSVDNAGNEELPHKILTGIKLDKTYPTIETPSRTPDGDVLPDQPVKVSVNITDATGQVKNATLYYTLNNGTTWEEPIPMNYNASTGLYEATIPPQQAGTAVGFKIVAYDYAGNNATLDGTEPYCTYQVIPEFPSFLILPLFMIATPLAVAIYKRKRFGMR